MNIGKHLGKYKSIIATTSMVSEITKTIDIVSIDYSPVKYAKIRRILYEDVSNQVPDLRLIFTL